ncbi:uncharacterized protein LOC131814849 isoform X2 [Mustela lutreola]|uniref:uncharacterized protein LOC131814849 isoform X2 n=1 Tax=Mustela lutreola TaxID=9666 RepID=UPI0027971FCB|nr:uncharacterized protein LOC131814849 isoform X2 [Mustela lutreola]
MKLESGNDHKYKGTETKFNFGEPYTDTPNPQVRGRFSGKLICREDPRGERASERAQAESAGKRPAMGACSEDPHLYEASGLLRFTSLLLSVCSAVTQSPGAPESAVDDSGNPVPLKGIQGASVLFLVIRNPELLPEVELESITWGIINQKLYTPVLQVSPRGDVPRWVNFQDKFEKRVHVVNTTTLRIDNLTLEDSGLYRVQQSYTRGRQYHQDFHLTVYGGGSQSFRENPQEKAGAVMFSTHVGFCPLIPPSPEAVPRPQIRATVLSLTPGWCNITMECNTTETRKNLTVTWENESLPRELEQRPAPGPAPNPWTLAVTLPLSRPSPSLTCVVSNQADKKAASQDLGDVCGRDQCCPLAWYLGICVVLLLILGAGAGLYLWKRRGMKNVEPGRGRLHFSFPCPDTSIPR